MRKALKRKLALEKREKFLAAERQIGLEALARDRASRAKAAPRKVQSEK